MQNGVKKSEIIPVVFEWWSLPCSQLGRKLANIDKFSDKLPPNSPDLNPLDFFVRARLRGTLTGPFITPESPSSREVVFTDCSRVRSRLEEVVAVNGDFIRWIISWLFNKHIFVEKFISISSLLSDIERFHFFFKVSTSSDGDQTLFITHSA